MEIFQERAAISRRAAEAGGNLIPRERVTMESAGFALDGTARELYLAASRPRSHLSSDGMRLCA
jgi:hypothetical protein